MFLHFRSFREKFCSTNIVWGYLKSWRRHLSKFVSRKFKTLKLIRGEKKIGMLLIFRNNLVFHSQRNKVKVTGVSWLWRNISPKRVQLGFNYQLSRRYFDWLRLRAIVSRNVLIGQKNTIFSMRNWRCFANFLCKVSELKGALWEMPVENLVV